MPKTYPALKRAIAQLIDQDQPKQALNCLVVALEQQTFWVNHGQKWWHLYYQAIKLINNQSADDPAMMAMKKQLIKLSMKGPQPWQGKETAYCLASVSIWAYLLGQHQKAVAGASAAHHAAPNWAYPDYLLGWYGLHLEGIEPVPYFVRAIKRDGLYWQKFTQDPSIKAHQGVLEAVKGALKKKML